MLTHQDMLNRLTSGSSGEPSMEVTLSRFIRFATAGLREGTSIEKPTKKGPQATFDF